MLAEAIKGDIEVIELENPGSNFVPKSWLEIDKLSANLVDDNIASLKTESNAVAAAAARGGRPTRRRRRRRPTRRRRRRRPTRRRRRRPTRRRRTKRIAKKTHTTKLRKKIQKQPRHYHQSGGKMVENDTNVRFAMESGVEKPYTIRALNNQAIGSYFHLI